MEDKWIGIKNKKPKPRTRVLVFVENEYSSPKQIAFRINKNNFLIEKWNSVRNDISHWQSLPSKPKGLKNKYSKNN